MLTYFIVIMNNSLYTMCGCDRVKGETALLAKHGHAF